MTYLSQEQSAFGGKPFELYRFARETNTFLYTSADRDISFGGESYISIPIERDGFNQTQDLAKTSLTINMEGTELLPQLYVSSSPSQIVSLTIFGGHEDDPDNEVITLWKGRVVSTRFVLNVAELTGESIITSLKRNGLRRLYQRNCPHQLYNSSTCRASRAAFQTNATLSSVSGNVVSATAFGTLPSGRLTGGFLEWDNQGVVDRRWITNHTGSQVTLRLPIPSIAAGANVRTFAGCARTLNVCINTFNNVENFGGMPWIPEKNPFTEDVF